MQTFRVGYAGGTTKDPTYYKMGDHTEVVDILYDPKLTSFEVLVKIFIASRDHKNKASRQYRSVILCHDDQKGILSVIWIGNEPLIFLEIAERFIDIKKSFDYIGIEKFQDFYLAENKHQKNSLRRHPGTLMFKGIKVPWFLTFKVFSNVFIGRTVLLHP